MPKEKIRFGPFGAFPPSTILFALILILSLSFCLIYISRGSLANYDEAIYAQSAKEMFKTGQWLDPTWQNGLPFYHKPPLYMWLTSASYCIFGTNEFATRLWPALFGIGCIISVFYFAKYLFGSLSGGCAVLLLLSNLHFQHLTTSASLDTMLSFFITVSAYFFLRSMDQPELRRHSIISGLAAGLAIMSKGAAGLAVLPIIALIFFLHPNRNKWILARAFEFLFTLFLIALPWHIYSLLVHGSSFVNEYVGYQVLQRALSPIEGNGGDPLLYLRLLVSKAFLTILSVVLASVFLVAQKQKNFFWAGWVLLFSSILIIGGYSLMQTRLDQYIAPVYPLLAVLGGYGSSQAILWLAGHSIHLQLILDWARMNIPRLISEKWVFVLALTVLILSMSVILAIRVPAHDYNPQIKTISVSIRTIVPPGHSVILWDEGVLTGKGDLLPWALEFYCDRPIVSIEDLTKENVSSPPPHYVLSSEANWERLNETRAPLVRINDTVFYILD